MDPGEIGLAAVLGFFAVAFLQSGIDKVADWNGNLEWLQGHFANSPLKGSVRPMLGFLTLAELLTGALCLFGILGVFVRSLSSVPAWALGACCATLLMLFFGQRVAKDYPGAAVIAAYFAVALLGLAFA